jgi:hypothetical protein
MAKKPHIAAEPTVRKKPTTGGPDPDVVKHDSISWGLEFSDFNGEWSWRKLKADHVAVLHCELVALEGQTLYGLLQQKKIKEIPVEHMTRKAKDRLKGIRLEEADTLWELRLPKKWRVWGLVQRATFYFLWWDEYETACGPPPRGTRRG